MPAFICTTCGTQVRPSERPPETCPICTDERQYVNPEGQSWTTLDALRRSHFTTLREEERGREEEPGLIGLGTSPKFGIGQRALLVRTSGGNVLWDCISLLDAATVAMIQGIGGLAGVAISHPHYYTTMVEWARAFDCPVHLHAADRRWVMRDDPALRFWEGDENALLPGVTLVRLGGHFAGGTVLHWREGAGGKGALLSGDIAQVTPDKMVSFMWSYPDLLPLPASVVRQIAERAAGYAFDRIYGAFWESVVPADGNAVVARSAARYVRLLETPGQP